ncbi:MAG: sialidase family protein, partial [Rhizomicrobium sp.]
QFYHVSVDNQFPYNVYGAQQDNSNVGIASYDDFGAIDDKDWYIAGGGECGFVIADPRDPDIIYSDSENGINRFNRHTMQSETISVWPVDASGHPASELEHRFNWTSPLMMSPHDPDTLYWGAERLFKTTDDGKSWTAVSGDLTRDDKSKQIASGGPITKDITSVEYYDTIFAIAESPLVKGHLWVGTDDGLVQVSDDDGGHWTNVTPHGMPEWGTVDMIEPSHFDDGTAYVAVDRHKLDDIHPYIFKTTDGGKTWTPLGAGIPEGAFVHAVREDPVNRGLLYAATETGVYVSFDGGADWQTLQLNLPQSPVHDLVVKGDDLVVATHGRSFWILDDVTPLRQIASATTDADVLLYKPQSAYRLYYPDAVDTRRPVGTNPPAGALIDYYFASKPAGEVTIDILDEEGNLVRHLSSKAEATKEQPPEWPDQIYPTNTLPAEKGMNRFVWNLRYDDPVQIPGAFYEGLAPRGPIALPGKYTVKLTIAGETQSQPLIVVRDPRVTGPEDGMRQKFELSEEAWHDLDALHRAVNDIRAAKTEVAALHKKLDGKPGSAALLAEGDALAAKAKTIEGTLMQVNLTGSEGNLNFPDMLNEQIYAFAAGLEDADTSPTKQELETYADMHAKLKAQLAGWDAVKTSDLAAFHTDAQKTM